MPKFRVTDPNGQTFEITAPDGATEQEALAYAQRSFKMAAAPDPVAPPAKGFGQQLDEFIDDIPRQTGRAGRAALQGLGNTFDFITSPVRNAANSFIAGSQERVNRYRPPAEQEKPFQFKAGAGQALSDVVGLPKPRNATERVVDDTIGAIAGGAVPIAAGANMARNATGAGARAIGEMMAANPVQQAISAGAGGAAGSAVRESGGGERAQLVASLVGGFGAPAAMNAGQRVAQAGGRTAARMTTPREPSPVSVDITINNALRDTGVNLGQLAPEVAQSLRSDVAQALRVSDTLDPAAIRRLADYHATGLTPTQARLTLDPADITRQANLAKQGANSNDPAAQALARTQNANNRQLTSGLNQLGASTADDAVAGGQRIVNAITARNDQMQAGINQRYNNARNTEGRSAVLDSQSFADRANALLDNHLLGGKLPSDVRNVLERDWTQVVRGGTPEAPTNAMPGLTVDAAEQIKTRIAALQRSSSDGAERRALGLVRQALDETPLQPGQQIGQEAIAAFNNARTRNRRYMAVVENTPALQAVRDGVAPDKFVETFIIGSGGNANTMDVGRLRNAIRNSPEGLQAVREQIVSSLKQKALSGAADEVGNFSQSAYNKALNAIGNRKLAMFFDSESLAQLRAIGRAASYEQVQPIGSAVNNSNTAGAVGGMLDRIGSSSLLGKIPLGRQILGEPAQNIAISMRSGRALDAPRALTLPEPARTGGALPYSVSPNIFPRPESEEEKQRRLLGIP